MADEDLPPSYVKSCKKFLKKIKQKNKASSSQAGGPSPKEPGFKQLRLTSDKLVGYYKRNK
jgi:hypothetical protein